MPRAGEVRPEVGTPPAERARAPAGARVAEGYRPWRWIPASCRNHGSGRTLDQGPGLVGRGALWPSLYPAPSAPRLRREALYQVVEKPSPQLCRLDSPGLGLQEPICPGRRDPCPDRFIGQAGTGREQLRTETIVESQGEEGELQDQVLLRQGAPTADEAAGPGGAEIGVRVTVLGAALDPRGPGVGQLGVGAGPNAEIIPKLPVVEVMAAAPSREGMGGHLIRRIACGRQTFEPLRVSW